MTKAVDWLKHLADNSAPVVPPRGQCEWCGYAIHLEADGDTAGNLYHPICKAEIDALAERARNADKARKALDRP